jgi:hypothetical protein
VGRFCRPSAVVAFALLASVFGGSGRGEAADAACFDSYESTQRLRKDDKLVEAREQALVCARDACPAALRKDCVRWSSEIAALAPTLVFATKDDHGRIVSDAAVYLDDHKVADAIDGKPVSVDPGPHKVRFESGEQRTEVDVVVAKGEANRRIEGTLASPPPLPPPTPVSTHRRIPTSSLVLGGAAAVGLVSFVTFAALGRVRQGCAPTCTSSQVTTMRVEYAAADASWITGLLAASGALAFWIAQPAAPRVEPQPAPGATALELDARPVRGGAAFGLRGSF